MTMTILGTHRAIEQKIEPSLERQEKPTYEQITLFVEDVKPRLLADAFTTQLCIEHPNIVLGEE